MDVGTVIGQYKVVRQVGEGGMGAVYLAEHSLIGRRAAIKVLLPGLSSQREIVDRFFNEARATSAIPDPGIVQVFDFGIQPDGSAYIVMEFLEGEALDARMRKLGRIPPYEALRIIRQAAGSLAAAHARGIVHRDLKPENIFLVRDPEAQGGERPKILDFGIAKLGGIGAGNTRTRTDAIMGTPVYMSPEQCRGAGLVDHRSDIYSLGCVLYHVLTGRPPFDAEGVGEIIAAHLREPPRAPSTLVPGFIDGLDQTVLTCLAKDPGQRYQQMTDLQRACDALMARLTGPPGTNAQQPTVISTPVPAGFRTDHPGSAQAAIARSDHPSQPETVMAQAPASPTGQPTTLGSAAGQASSTLPPVKRSWAPAIVVALLLAGGGITAGLVLGRGKQDASAAKDPVGEPGSGSGVASGSTGAGSAGSGSAGAGIATTATPDAGVAQDVMSDAAIETTVTTAVDAGTVVEVGSNGGSNAGVVKKKPGKKRPAKPSESAGSASGGMYDDR